MQMTLAMNLCQFYSLLQEFSTESESHSQLSPRENGKINENQIENENMAAGQSSQQLTEGGEDTQKDVGVFSEAMEASVQEIQHKISQFTQQVSGLLEAGRNFFVEVANAFEERIISLHQKQIDKWQEEIELLQTVDALNEEANYRLTSAQEWIRSV